MSETTFYPDAHPESTSVDGLIQRDFVDESLATIRAGAGTSVFDALTAGSGVNIHASTTSNQYQVMARSIFLFDTSALPDGDDISGAVFSLTSIAKTDDLNGGASSNSVSVLVASTPASNTSLATSDYSQLGSTDFGRSVILDNIVSDGSTYNDITINSTGRATISKTGITKFGLRFGWDFDNTTTGLTWSSGDRTRVGWYYADEAGTSRDPKLVVTHAAPVTGFNGDRGIGRGIMRGVGRGI